MNIQSIMAQAQKMQKEIMNKQEEIYQKQFTGNSAWVRVTMNGKKQNIKVDVLYNEKIETEEDKDMLGDMIAIAFQDALSKIEKEIENKLGSYSKQLGGLM